MSKFYITTAIPYVNAAPHIGFALEAVQSDTYVRYLRSQGKDVFFASGTDENSLKNVRAAEKEELSTQQLVDKYADIFLKLKETDVLNLSYDIFNRTSSPHHFVAAQKLWEQCKKEDIYKKSYTGLYCVGCEEFYSQDELVNGLCPEHKTEPEKIDEENYFFKLSNYQEEIEELIKNDKVKIIPEFRKNEVLSFIKQGLKDFSISRSEERAKGWGVPVPNDAKQIMYVWYDALATYLSSLGYGKNEDLFNKYWTNDTKKIHFIGKGITRFHAIYWIAMLLSADLPLPDIEFVHGYITVDGQKISKSLGNTVSPFEVAEKFGTDVLRYYLIREIPTFDDGDYSERRLREVYNSELANGLGNLVARVSKLCEKSGYIATTGQANLTHEATDYHEALENFELSKALLITRRYLGECDARINKDEPWKIKDKDELKEMLTYYVNEIIKTAKLLNPFMPETSEKILYQFRDKVESSTPLFPRLA